MSERMAQGAPADAVDSAVDGLHELAVVNPSFFVEKLGAECSDLQGLRELTVNGLQAIAALVEALVREWFEQTLIEAVLSAHALAGSPHWSSEQIDELVSESALVTACLPRQLLDAALHKRLAQRLGREAVKQRP
jgi:hypothetical protein